jgi:hypothetical protein
MSGKNEAIADEQRDPRTAVVATLITRFKKQHLKRMRQ